MRTFFEIVIILSEILKYPTSHINVHVLFIIFLIKNKISELRKK